MVFDLLTFHESSLVRFTKCTDWRRKMAWIQRSVENGELLPEKHLPSEIDFNNQNVYRFSGLRCSVPTLAY